MINDIFLTKRTIGYTRIKKPCQTIKKIEFPLFMGIKYNIINYVNFNKINQITFNFTFTNPQITPIQKLYSYFIKY